MLDISPILLFSSAIIFLTVLVLLNKSLYQPLFFHMDEREKSIKNDLESVCGNANEVNALVSVGQSGIAKAKQEASLIRENAYAEAKALGESKMAEFKSELDLKYNLFKNDLYIQKATVKNSLLVNIPDFKEKIALKISSI